MRNLELIANEFTNPEANQMMEEATSLVWKKDSIAKAMKLLKICRTSNHYMETILEDMDDSIALTDELVDNFQYHEAREMMKLLTTNNRHFFEFANVCTYTICEAADSKDAEYISGTIIEYSDILSRNGDRFNRMANGSLIETYNNFKNIEADFLIDLYLEKNKK